MEKLSSGKALSLITAGGHAKISECLYRAGSRLNASTMDIAGLLRDSGNSTFTGSGGQTCARGLVSMACWQQAARYV